LTPKKLILLDFANRDADKIIKNTVGEYGIDVSMKLIDELEKSLNRIGRYPKLGSLRVGQEISFDNLRSYALKKAPYVIFYLEHEEYIGVIRILHQKQDIPFWLENLG
jgi:toxin ParE1/3/4